MVSSACAGPPFWRYAIPTESSGGDIECPHGSQCPNVFAVATKSSGAAALEAASG